MKLLLDTHTLLWSLLASPRLSAHASAALVDPDVDVFVSAASAWEIAIKESTGKLRLPGPSADWLPVACEKTRFTWLPLAPATALRVSSLPWHHRDPFDRLLVAQASEGFVLVTADARLAAYGVPILET